jgi:hypothetical protein
MQWGHRRSACVVSRQGNDWLRLPNWGVFSELGGVGQLATPDMHVSRSGESELHTTPIHLQDDDFDLVAYANRFADFPSEYEHLCLLAFRRGKFMGPRHEKWKQQNVCRKLNWPEI